MGQRITRDRVSKNVARMSKVRVRRHGTLPGAHHPLGGPSGDLKARANPSLARAFFMAVDRPLCAGRLLAEASRMPYAARHRGGSARGAP